MPYGGGCTVPWLVAGVLGGRSCRNIPGMEDVNIKSNPPEGRGFVGDSFGLFPPLLSQMLGMDDRWGGDIDGRNRAASGTISLWSANVKCEDLLAMKYSQRIKLEITGAF